MNLTITWDSPLRQGQKGQQIDMCRKATDMAPKFSWNGSIRYSPDFSKLQRVQSTSMPRKRTDHPVNPENRQWVHV